MASEGHGASRLINPAFQPKGNLIAVIGDEDTCVGFLLGGIGEINRDHETNFKVVDKNTTVADLEETFKTFVKRGDIDIILITHAAAEMIRDHIDRHTKIIPTVLEIPSKSHPYDKEKDPMFKRAKQLLGSANI